MGPALCSAGFSDFSGVFAESERGVTVEVGEELSITVDGALGWEHWRIYTGHVGNIHRRWDNGGVDMYIYIYLLIYTYSYLFVN